MKSRALLSAVVLSAALSAGAADVRHFVYVVRADDTQQGIYRYDITTAERSPLASFIFTIHATPYPARGRLSLTALEDRVVAQGMAYHEFDIASGQLLRRYPALSGYNSWAFYGVGVDEVTAGGLGLQPGFYGFPYCPPGGGDLGTGCAGSVTFPGYDAPASSVSPPDVLLRRGLDPADTSLSVVKRFPSDSMIRRRFPAVDVGRHSFWFWENFGQDPHDLSNTNRLKIAAVSDGLIGAETTVREERIPVGASLEDQRVAESFAYSPEDDSTFFCFGGYRTWADRLMRVSTDGSSQTEFDRTAYELGSVTAEPLSLPASYTQVLPAIGETPGVNGTYWRSDVWLYNPSDTPTTVTLRRVTRPDDRHQFAIDAHATLRMTNALSRLGGGVSGDGVMIDALLIESPYRAGNQVSVYSRTYTNAPSGGSYGEAVPALPSRVGYSNHLADFESRGDLSAESASLLILDKRDPSQFRHNLGVVNSDDKPLTVRMRYTETSGVSTDADHVREFTVASHSVRIVTLESIFPAEVVETQPPRIWLTADRPAPIWLSMVDNRTGDASFIPFTNYGIEAGPSARLAFPAVAHTPGANGTLWKTDVFGVFPSYATEDGIPQNPTVNFYPASGACVSSQFHLQASLGMPATSDWLQYFRTTFADVGRQACSSDVRGALEVRTGSWMAAFSRTYTTDANGGTYGEILPLYPPRGWPSRHFAGIEVNDAFRVNVGLYNGSESSSGSLLILYRDDGTKAAETTVTLDAHDSVQLPLAQLFGSDLPGGTYSLSVIAAAGVGTWPYVSTVDNITGDPTNWW